MEITKQFLLDKLEVLRASNTTALENEETSCAVYEQEEAIRDTFDIVEKMLKDIPDEEPKHIANPTTAGDLITHLKSYKPEHKMMGIFWGEYDIRCMNKDDNYNSETDEEFDGTPLTDKQVTNILESLTHNHDACNGVSWDTIEDTIQWYKNRSLTS